MRPAVLEPPDFGTAGINFNVKAGAIEQTEQPFGWVGIADLAINDPSIVMVNRNQGSGTRIVIDSLLSGAQPAGYAIQPSNHQAVAAAIVQHRADWGIAIEAAARASQLAFIPLQEERFDFVVPTERRQRPAITAFVKMLADDSTRRALRDLGLHT